MTSRIEWLKQLQADYHELLKKYENLLVVDELDTAICCDLIDEVSSFWLTNMPGIIECLEKISKTNKIVILSGAMYLDVKYSEEFYLKLFGDIQIVIDPILKLEVFIRRNPDNILSTNLAQMTKRSFRDTIEALATLDCEFLFLPIQNLVCYKNKTHLSEIDSLVWLIISNMFSGEYESKEAFIESFDSLKAIEQRLPSDILQYMMFSDDDNRDDDLNAKMDKYSLRIQSINDHLFVSNKVELFILALYSQLMQIADIIVTSSAIDSLFAVRTRATFSWLLLLKDLFSTHDEYAKMIDYAIHFSRFRMSISREKFTPFEFRRFSYTAKLFKLGDRLLQYHSEKSIPLDAAKRMDLQAFNEFSLAYHAEQN